MFDKFCNFLVLSLVIFATACSTQTNNIRKFSDTKISSEKFKQIIPTDDKEAIAKLKIDPEEGSSINKVSGIYYELYLRSTYCKELFLEQGIDIDDEQVGSDYKKAFEKCRGPVIPNNDIERYRKYVEQNGGSYFPAPELGIALSGGGTRSASFSIGVLKALDELGILNNVGVISSVSGGSYANYWLITKEYEKYYSKYTVEKNLGKDLCDYSIFPFEREDIFRTEVDKNIFEQSKFQHHLEESSYLLNVSNNSFMRGVENFWSIGTNVINLPIHWVTNGLMDWGYNNSVLGLVYRQGIERTYGLVPNENYGSLVDYRNTLYPSSQYHNGRPGYIFRWAKDVQAKRLTFESYKKLLKNVNQCRYAKNEENSSVFNNPLPMPIINATIGREFKKIPGLEKSVFSFSPLQYGSGHTGYRNIEDIDRALSISKAVSISGAAVDSNTTSTSVDVALKVFNLELGYKLRNPSVYGSSEYWKDLHFYFHKLLPFPLYALHSISTDDENKPYVRLSDGGHSENLGLFSLIQRGTKKIIVVDAEQDGKYKFEALRRLKANLENEFGVTIVDVNNPHRSNSEFIGESDVDPVTRFRVRGLFYPDGSERPIDIMYVKLSFDRKIMNKTPEYMDKNIGICTADLKKAVQEGKYPCSVMKQYKEERSGEKKGFPHNSTADVFYSKDQYSAYRDLGYFMINNNLKPLYNRYWKSSVSGNIRNRYNYYKTLF